MSDDLPGTWPERPAGFYEDWAVFNQTLLNQLIASLTKGDANGDRMASLLLAGGAGLGAAGMIALIEANRDAITRRGEEWGMPGLLTLMRGVGVAFGGLGGAMLTRLLSRRAKPETVDAMQDRLAGIRREFEELRRERDEGALNKWAHWAAVELLFSRAAVVL